MDTRTNNLRRRSCYDQKQHRENTYLVRLSLEREKTQELKY